MSASLSWRPIPVDPAPLATTQQPFLELMKRAVNDVIAWTDEEDFRTGVEVLWDSSVVTYLRGCLAVLPDPPGDDVSYNGHDGWQLELAADIHRFLVDLEREKKLLVQVSY